MRYPNKPQSPEFTEWYYVHCQEGQVFLFTLEVYADGVDVNLPPEVLPGLLASWLRQKSDQDYSVIPVTNEPRAIGYYVHPKDASDELYVKVYTSMAQALIDDMGGAA